MKLTRSRRKPRPAEVQDFLAGAGAARARPSPAQLLAEAQHAAQEGCYSAAYPMFCAAAEFGEQAVALPQALHGAAQCALALDQCLQAIRHCERALALLPGYCAAWLTLGRAQYNMGEALLASRTLQLALALASGELPVRAAVQAALSLSDATQLWPSEAECKAAHAEETMCEPRAGQVPAIAGELRVAGAAMAAWRTSVRGRVSSDMHARARALGEARAATPGSTLPEPSAERDLPLNDWQVYWRADTG